MSVVHIKDMGIRMAVEDMLYGIKTSAVNVRDQHLRRIMLDISDGKDVCVSSINDKNVRDELENIINNGIFNK